MLLNELCVRGLIIYGDLIECAARHLTSEDRFVVIHFAGDRIPDIEANACVVVVALE